MLALAHERHHTHVHAHMLEADNLSPSILVLVPVKRSTSSEWCSLRLRGWKSWGLAWLKTNTAVYRERLSE